MNSVGMFSIGGIASGLDTTGIIEQLMQLERIPITRMQSTQQQLRARDDAWGQINTKLSTLRAAVDRINRQDRFSSLVRVTSSDEAAVAVTARPGASTGSLSFSVSQLAQAHQLRGGVVADPDAVLDGTSFSVTRGDTTVEVDLTDGRSLRDVALELNAAKAGFTASVVQTGTGEHRLVVSSSASGLDAGLTVATDSAAGGLQLSDLQVARDAVITMGSGAGAIEITRSSNTIDDLVPGASITLKRVTGADDAPVTVTSTQDVDGAVAAVKEYTTALNGTIELLAKLTKSDPAAAGVLAGDSTARRMLEQLRSAVSAPTGLPTDGLHAAFQVGLSVDRYGAVTLDEAKLEAAIAQDFDAVARLFGGGTTTADDPDAVATRGLAAGMSTVLRTMEGSGGLVARARQGLTSQIRIYQDRIDGFDVRLATRESTLRRQFTAMESALATLNSQGGWLQSQLAGLQNLHAQR